MGISCEEVWRDISDYIDEDLDPIRQAALDQHFAECRQCTALLDGTRNIIGLYRDQRVLTPPDGFHERLYQRLGEKNNPSRRSFLAWTLTAAAAVPLGLALFSARRLIVPAHDAQSPANGPDARQVPETVAISQDQDVRLYHVAGCSRLHGKPKFLPVEEAIREGYSPCPICIGKRKPAKKGVASRDGLRFDLQDGSFLDYMESHSAKCAHCLAKSLPLLCALMAATALG